MSICLWITPSVSAQTTTALEALPALTYDIISWRDLPVSDRLPDDQEVTEATAAIRQTSTFAFGVTGWSISPLPIEKALLFLIKKKSLSALIALVNDKNDVARLYGLTGLRYLEASTSNVMASEYEKASNILRMSKASVEVSEGCIFGSRPVSNVASKISAGAFNLFIKRNLASPASGIARSH